MARATPEDLQSLLELLRQLRGISGLREDKPGIFHLRGVALRALPQRRLARWWPT